MGDVRKLIEADAAFLDRLIAASEHDPCRATCETCGNPFFTDTDPMISTCEVGGCWYAATGREKDRPQWCLDRAAILRAMEGREP